MEPACTTRHDDAIRACATGERKGQPALTCAQALELARTMQVEPPRIREACDRLGIKIMDCQLGCFA
jgi:hypothetical protein